MLRLKDTIPINWVKDSNDFLYSDFNKKGVFPLRFIVEDTSKNINGTLTNYFVDFPEVSFVLDFNYFPDQIIYGKPKMLKSYKNEKLLIKLNYTFTSMLFYDFINNPNSEKKKKAFVSWFGN